jgi:predicted transcriptional regulator
MTTHKYKVNRMKTGKELVAIEVLETIKKNPRITPLEIAEKIKTSAQYVRNTLRVLTELSLVETPVRGVYLITDFGKEVLNRLEK